MSVLDEQEMQVQGSHTHKQALTQWVNVLGTRVRCEGIIRQPLCNMPNPVK